MLKIIMVLIPMIIAWLIAYLLCEYKYLWCKGKCIEKGMKCRNWKCRYHNLSKWVSDSIEKQIPKIPDYEGDGEYDGKIIIDTWICPNCEEYYEIEYDEYEYCPKCGQHIDHSKYCEEYKNEI